RLEVELRLIDRVDLLGVDDLVVERGEQVLERLLEERGTADGALDDGTRRLAAAESRNANLRSDTLRGLLHRGFNPLRLHLELEGNQRARQTFCRDYHVGTLLLKRVIGV